MPPPNDGNQYLPFDELMKLEKLDAITFKSLTLAYSPGGQLPNAVPRAYGGHAYAQSAWAASQTVAEGFLIYNAVGYFHLPGSRTTPFVYKVSKLPDGRSYLTRFVTVTQEGSDDVCFTCTVSFKKPEANLLDLQEKVDLWQLYKPALEGKRPEDFKEAHGVDIPWYWKLREETGYNDAFPGLQSTKVDMEAYNKDKHPLDRRELLFYRIWDTLPSDPNLHLCAHLYASDRNSLYVVCNLMNVGDLYTSMSSLVHSTSFFGPIEHMMFGPSKSNESPLDDTAGFGRWFCREDRTSRTANGRAMFDSRIWSADGTQVAHLMQDGMIRYAKKPTATADETAALDSRKAGWKSRGKL